MTVDGEIQEFRELASARVSLLETYPYRSSREYFENVRTEIHLVRQEQLVLEESLQNIQAQLVLLERVWCIGWITFMVIAALLIIKKQPFFRWMGGSSY